MEGLEVIVLLVTVFIFPIIRSIRRQKPQKLDGGSWLKGQKFSLAITHRNSNGRVDEIENALREYFRRRDVISDCLGLVPENTLTIYGETNLKLMSSLILPICGCVTMTNER